MPNERPAMPTAECGPFTRFVAQVSQNREPNDVIHEVWTTLRRTLRKELARRGLWQQPPSYLGVLGASTWRDRHPDPLDELVADAYVFVFVERIQNLQVRMEAGRDIDALVTLMLRGFLQERQQSHDPIGHRIFTVLRTAVREARDDGTLQVVHGPKTIAVSTVLAAPGDRSHVSITPIQPADVASWTELLPELITSTGRAFSNLVKKLTSRLTRLQSEGFEVFRFGDLVAALRVQARNAWATQLNDSLSSPVPIPSDLGSNDFDLLRADIGTEIDSLDTDERTRRYLWSLWLGLGAWANADSDRVPSYRRIGQTLGIPRDRLPGLFKVLAGMIREREGRSDDFRGLGADKLNRHSER